MHTALVLTSSALGEHSASSRLVAEAVAHVRNADPATVFLTRDLDREPVPHFDANAAAAMRGGEPANDHQSRARRLSDTLVDEVMRADTLIVGAPMYNFGIASTLKSWFDYILRAGVTFRYSEAGAEGLLGGKRAIVVMTRGGLYSDGPQKAQDSQEPHLRTLFEFVGITDVSFVRAEGLAFGDEHRERALDAARAEIAGLVPALNLRAA